MLRIPCVDVQPELDGTWTNVPLHWTDAVNLANHLDFVRQDTLQVDGPPRTGRQVWKWQYYGQVPLPSERRRADNVTDDINRFESDGSPLLDLNSRPNPPTVFPA